MKKFSILFLAALLVVAFTMPAAAIENVFGGYWRTRFVTQTNFTGEDLTGGDGATITGPPKLQTGPDDLQQVDTRTRIYYTAIINENLKFVNKFEFDAVWGSPEYGDIGTDGKVVEIKNSYADFNLGPVNSKIGAQGAVLSRGFLFDDDFAGAVVTFKGEGFSIPVLWIKANESGAAAVGTDSEDEDYYALNPSFSAGDVTINPVVAYATNKEANMDIYFIGLNADAKIGAGSVWFSGLYETGDADEIIEVSAYLAALGGSFNLGAMGINAQAFYATGDDNLLDNDWDQFYVPAGQCYYWSEIMGLGTFDQQASNNSPAAGISNIIAANVGVSFKPAENLKLSANLWYALLAEDDGRGNDDLGTEIDLKATYTLVEGLNLDVVAAYLFAGDATTEESPDDADPYELGARLSLSF